MMKKIFWISYLSGYVHAAWMFQPPLLPKMLRLLLDSCSLTTNHRAKINNKELFRLQHFVLSMGSKPRNVFTNTCTLLEKFNAPHQVAIHKEIELPFNSLPCF